MNSEILIIGGGVIGLAIARELQKRGAGRIRLIESGACGHEASWAAAGMLGSQAEADGPSDFFDLCSASRDLYPNLAAELLDETGVDIELDQTGTLSLAFSESEALELQNRYAWQCEAGFQLECLSAMEVKSLEPLVSDSVHSAYLIPQDWQVENRKLLTALKSYAEQNGVEIIENAKVENLIFEGGKIAGAATGRGEFLADTTVLATGAWTSLIKLGELEFPVKVTPVRGQMICFWPETRSFRYIIYTKRGYIVPRADGRLLTGSTTEDAGFEKGVTPQSVDYLLDMAAEISPSLVGLEIADKWSGLRPNTPDGFPIVGPIYGIDGLIVAAGHYRNGILLAPITAVAVAESLLNGNDLGLFKSFRPDRFRQSRIAVGNSQ